MGGAHSRTKGHSFERLVADAYRKKWPVMTVRRSLQAHQPFEPDVVCEGSMPAGCDAYRFWTECQHADAPAPLTKLAQAERDSLKCGLSWLPLVVWRKSGSKVVYLTTRFWVVAELGVRVGPSLGPSLHSVRPSWQDIAVTVDFHEWLAALA